MNSRAESAVASAAGRRCSRWESGFSLLEVVVGMTVFSLIAVSVFALIWGVADTAEDIRRMESREQEMGRFFGLLRESMEALPLEGSLEIQSGDETLSGQDELTLRGTPTAFVFGLPGPEAEEVTFGLRPQVLIPGDLESEDGILYQLSMSRSDFGIDEGNTGMALRVGGNEMFFDEDENGRFWLPLIDAVKGFRWEYWDEDQQQWLEQWEEEDLPPLVALIVDDAYRGPTRLVVELPEHAREPSEVSADDGASTSTGGTTGTESRSVVNPAPGGGQAAPQGGGDRGGDRGRRGGGQGRPGGGGNQGEAASSQRGGGSGAPQGGGGGR